MTIPTIKDGAAQSLGMIFSTAINSVSMVNNLAVCGNLITGAQVTRAKNYSDCVAVDAEIELARRKAGLKAKAEEQQLDLSKLNL